MRICWMPDLEPERIVLPRSAAHLVPASHAGRGRLPAKTGRPHPADNTFVPSVITLQAGQWRKRVFPGFSNELPDGCIGLSARMKGEFPLPDALPYDLQAQGSTLRIGPVIAFLIAHEPLSPGVLDHYRGYFGRYAEIGGLIYVCALAGIHPETKTVEGYYYDPHADGGQTPWVAGIFPYPDVVWRRIWVYRDKRYDDLRLRTKGKIFNPYFPNKREMWTAMRSQPLLGRHLPHTRPLDGPKALKAMLDAHGAVYLKPVRGSMGEGVMRLEKTRSGCLLFSRQGPETRFLHHSRMWAAIRRLCGGRKYLIQQSVSFTDQNRPVDFRVIMQKDEQLQWTCAGIIARFGEAGRHYTNDVSSVRPGREALRTVYQLSDEEAGQIEEEMIALCAAACRWLDQTYGTFADVGIDMAVDAARHVWLLEINSNHQHAIPSYLDGDLQMYRDVLARPFAFAKAWAGFSS